MTRKILDLKERLKGLDYNLYRDMGYLIDLLDIADKTITALSDWRESTEIKPWDKYNDKGRNADHAMIHYESGKKGAGLI